MDFRILSPGDAPLLAELFDHIDTTYFRPHPMDQAGAWLIAHQQGLDVYAMLVEDDLGVAYGMLRGWDEGYATPSLGLAVRAERQHQGIGRRMMMELHRVARDRGAGSVRLRVHPDNVRARRLYELLGYQYRGTERGELVMELALGGDGDRGERSVSG